MSEEKNKFAAENIENILSDDQLDEIAGGSQPAKKISYQVHCNDCGITVQVKNKEKASAWKTAHNKITGHMHYTERQIQY